MNDWMLTASTVPPITAQLSRKVRVDFIGKSRRRFLVLALLSTSPDCDRFPSAIVVLGVFALESFVGAPRVPECGCWSPSEPG